jgi:type I restriction enzyme S subunit
VSTELPQGWIETSLGQLATYVNGKAFNKLHWKEQGLPIIRIQNLNNPNASFNYSDEAHEEKYKVQNGDLLIAWSASLGAYIWKRGDAWLNQHIFRVEPYSDIVDTRYLYYAVTNSIDELYKKSHGMGMVHVTKGKFEGHEVWLPPLNEQIRIADKLDSVLAKVDEAQARLEKIPTLLKRFRQSVLAAATSGELTREWRENNAEEFSWSVLSLGDIAEVFTGVTPLKKETSYYEDGTIPWLTSSVTGKPLVTKAENFVTEKAVKECRLKLFSPGTLLIAMYGEGKTRGQVTEIAIAATINQACAAVVVNQEIVERKYIKLSIENNYEKTRMMAEGGNQPNLNLSKVRSISISLPNKSEQNEIVRRVESLFALADAVEKQYLAAKQRLDRLTQSLLAKAFRGELVPQDPNDESAAELLKRIQAERQAQAPAKRSRKQPA